MCYNIMIYFTFAVVPKAFSIDAIMQEFRLNGLDSPYDPDEEVPQINRDRKFMLFSFFL